jgi:hypothetical protein
MRYNRAVFRVLDAEHFSCAGVDLKRDKGHCAKETTDLFEHWRKLTLPTAAATYQNQKHFGWQPKWTG